MAMSACSAVGPISAPTRGEASAISSQFWMPWMVSIGRMYSMPEAPLRRSKWSTRASYLATSIAEPTLGAKTPVSPGTTTASRSAPVSPVSSALGRTNRPTLGYSSASRPTASRMASRAVSFSAGGTESSRSRQRQSAPAATALSNQEGLFPGTEMTVR